MSPDSKPVYDVHECPAPAPWFLLSLQHLFAMFGATVLVPFLTGLNPAIALISSGCGTLIYIVCTKGKIPVYLGSSFAFIGPIIAAKTIGGAEGALVGCVAAGVVYLVVAAMIAKFGVRWLLRLLPPVVIGPVIMVIGLGLAGIAVKMATGQAAGGPYSMTDFTVAAVALITAIIFAAFMKGIFGLIPILFGIIGGYVAGIIAGIVDFSPVTNAPLFAVPDFIIPGVTVNPVFSIGIILMVAPVALVTIAEHIGDQTVISKVTGRNFLEDPGLHRSLLGDGLATMFASLIGGPPNTTYGENVGVVAITRVFKRLRHRRRGRAGDPVRLHRRHRRVHPDHPDGGHGRRVDPAVRHHRGIGRAAGHRPAGRLLEEAQPDHLVGDPGHRYRRRGHPRDRYGRGVEHGAGRDHRHRAESGHAGSRGR